ncbi:uncharacterized protein RJT21DRAFT_120850 [Scheffersomyces amazonensis]|uniref:uncharacterized protein n=1 Tax=Scheffersomyces amazonensis TaxID=1078765 RepID=UPI00315CC0C3
MSNNNEEEEDIHSLSTLSSLATNEPSDENEEDDEINDNDPIQLDEATKRQLQQHNRRQPSLLRRISTVASDYFNGPIGSDESSIRRSIVAEEAYDYLDLRDRHHTNEEWFGQDQIKQSFSRRSFDEEEEEDPTDIEEFPQIFGGANNSNNLSRRPSGAPLQRRRSTVVSAIQAVTTKLGFWDKEFHADRIKIILTYGNNYLFLILGFTIALCIYWGSYYNRTARFKNLNFVIINADNQIGQLPAIVGPVVESFFNLTAIQAVGTYHLWDYEKISQLANSHNNTITEEVYRTIHHQQFWAAFYITPNSTLRWYEALVEGSTDNFSPNDLLQVVYETGRDYNAVNNYIVTVLHNIIQGYYSYTPQTPLFEDLLQSLNSSQRLNVIQNAPSLLTTIPTFQSVDLIPVPNQIVQAPLQIGLIYLVIFSFFQFVMQIKVHMYIASKIKGFKYVAYRMLSSHVAYLVLALAYVTLNRAFGFKYNKTFGNSGFLVIWSFAYLTMAALGSIIEVTVLFLFAVKPQLIGFLLLFMAVINVSPTVSPIVLCPDFYRYGYAIPVRNSYDLMHVAYFNAWKGNMGRNLGILFAWIIISNAAMPFLMKWMAAKKAKEDAAQAEEKARIAQDNQLESKE